MTVRRLRTSWPAILVATAVLAAGCHATPPSSGASPVVVSPAPPPITLSAAETSILPHTPDDQSADDPIDHVIAYSRDGLKPRAIEELGKARSTASHRLMREGTITRNARTVRETTSTTPNHTP